MRSEHDQPRSCSRTACRWPAAASLSFRYATSQVWLLDLSGETDPSLYDLCPHHAETLTVPRGWERVDQRTAGEVVREPAGRDLVVEGAEPIGAGGYGGNRYAALSADLPRLAAELAEAEGGIQDRGRRVVVPSRELAPMAHDNAEEARGGWERRRLDGGGAQRRPSDAEEARGGWERRRLDGGGAQRRPSDAEEARGGWERRRLDGGGAQRRPSDDEEARGGWERRPSGGDEVPGQLALPVPEGSEQEAGDAVVVSIEFTGSRRKS